MSQAGSTSSGGGGGSGVTTVTGTATSSDGSTENIITVDLGDSGKVYRFYFMVTGRDTGTGEGVGYHVFASARTDGATATVIETEFVDADEDDSLNSAEIDFTVSGNNMILQITGVGGETISYLAVGNYISV